MHLWKHGEALEALETGIRSSRRLENLCRDFELQKVCYLPLNTFLLRPLHRLMHYKQVLERLCKDNPPNEADFRDCRGEPGGTAGPALQGALLGPGSVAVSQVFTVPQGRHRSPVPGQGLPVIPFHKVRIAKDSLFLPPWHVFPPLTVGGLVQRTLEALH